MRRMRGVLTSRAVCGLVSTVLQNVSPPVWRPRLGNSSGTTTSDALAPPMPTLSDHDVVTQEPVRRKCCLPSRVRGVHDDERSEAERPLSSP